MMLVDAPGIIDSYPELISCLPRIIGLERQRRRRRRRR